MSIREDITQLQNWSIGNCARSITLKEKRKWYEHCPERVVEEDDVKLIWDINVQCDNFMEARRPDLILVDKKAKTYVIINVALPCDCRIREKEIEKIEKYQNFKRELKRLWMLEILYLIECWNGTKTGFVGNS